MISKKISRNKDKVLDLFNRTSDLVVYEFETSFCIKVMLCYLEGFVDKDLMDRDIVKPIIKNMDNPKNIKSIVFISQIQEIDAFEKLTEELPYGKVALFFGGYNIAYLIELSKWDKRNIEESLTQPVIRGPKEAFIEDLSTNKSMLRRRLRSKDLVFEDYIFGIRTRTKVSLAYINGLVNESVLKEVRRRINKINIDAILESGYIEELIEDAPKSLLSTISNSERPDQIAGKILEGRVAILTDGTPHALTVPRLFIEGIMNTEDYYLRPYYASFLRLIRYFAMFISIYLPGAFVALELYHQEMIPTVLLISIAGARSGVPLPVTVETLLMILALAMIRESGLRLPKSIASTISIVGALILGQAIVEAKVISGITIIIVSISAIAEFMIPDLIQSLVLYRFLIVFLGGFAGLYGVTCGFIIITTQIVSLDSFGIPFGWPIAPTNLKKLAMDTAIRLPIWMNLFRPRTIEKEDVRRQMPIKRSWDNE